MCYSLENLSSGRRIMLKLIKVALNLKLPLCYDLKKSGNFKFRATFTSLSFILRPELKFSGLYDDTAKMSLRSGDFQVKYSN